MDTVLAPHEARPRQWTAKQSAAFVHDRLLASRGFERRGTRSARRDFVERDIEFGTVHDGDDRLLLVVFGLAWADTPAGLPDIAWTGVGGSLKKTYTQPFVTESELDGELMDAIEEDVLGYLLRPRSPLELVDQLLSYEGKKHPVLDLRSMHSVAHYMAAAWGALVIGDADRCARGARRAREALDEEDGSDVVSNNLLEHQIAALAELWPALHNERFPRSL